VDNLVLTGQVERAHALFERLLSYANDVGLLAEQVDPASGEQLGNFPQAFTHMALVTSASHLSAAREGRVDFGASHDFAELALDRLLSAR
jgi:GH15 family glucan-1,4-alpha-glucosidase